MFSVPCTKDIGSVCVSSSINMCVCHKICCWQHRPSKAKYQQQCEFTNNAHLKFSLIAIYFCEDMDFTDYPQSVQTAPFALPRHFSSVFWHGGYLSRFSHNSLPVSEGQQRALFGNAWLQVTYIKQALPLRIILDRVATLTHLHCLNSQKVTSPVASPVISWECGIL